jgi:hypothetical protein
VFSREKLLLPYVNNSSEIIVLKPKEIIRFLCVVSISVVSKGICLMASQKKITRNTNMADNNVENRQKK